MDKILLVEDSSFFSGLVSDAIRNRVGVKVIVARDYECAKDLLTSGDDKLELAIVDLNLPDAPDGEVVELIAEHKIASIVYSSSLTKELRSDLFDKGMIDSVPKDSPSSLDYTVSLVKRILRNRNMNALVVEDSRTTRKFAVKMLKQQKLNVMEADNGTTALDLINNCDSIDLVLLDYNLPDLNGFELIKTIRKDFSKDRMAIIGMSGNGDPDLAIKFIKYGANDFIYKPFTAEELLCRVSQNLELIDLIDDLKQSATKDFLTGLYNRRHLFDVAEKIYSNAMRDHFSLTVAMIDIDHFKIVNDTYGHDVGDMILKNVANEISNSLRKADIIARFGGEEFCIICIGLKYSNAMEVLERVRIAIENLVTDIGDKNISVTVSIGACTELHGSIDAMIKSADICLYKVKESGRNMVIIEQPKGKHDNISNSVNKLIANSK